MTILPDAKPHLLRGVKLKHDLVRGQWVLLAPERVVNANPIAVEVLKRCTGQATFAEIIDDLAASFKAEKALIESDVTKLLNGLIEKRMVAL